MKKILLTIACLLTSLAMVQAVSLSWSFDSTVTPSSDASGTSLGFAVGMGWVVQLIEYDGGYAAAGAGNVITSTTVGPNASVPFKTAQLISYNVGDSAISVYARILDGAGHYVNLGVNGGAGFYTTADGGSSVEESYVAEGFSGTGGTASSRGTWIAIPEPGTMILFGLGGLVIAARRKFRK
jgi:hypothetical protein